MLKRILVAIPIVIIVALAAIFQSWVMIVLAAVLALATQFEIVRALDQNGKPVVTFLSYAFAVVLAAYFVGFFILLQKGMDYASWMPLMLLCTFVVLIMLVFIVSMFSGGILRTARRIRSSPLFIRSCSSRCFTC